MFKFNDLNSRCVSLFNTVLPNGVMLYVFVICMFTLFGEKMVWCVIDKPRVGYMKCVTCHFNKNKINNR